MKYTESQINAALVVADFHNGINNVTRDECDTAVSRLAGAPLSSVLAVAYRGQKIRLNDAVLALKEMCEERMGNFRGYSWDSGAGSSGYDEALREIIKWADSVRDSALPNAQDQTRPPNTKQP